MSLEDPNDMPLGKLPYERPHREEPPPSLEDLQTLAMDPVKWKPVSLGLALIFSGYGIILGMVGLFTVFYLFNLVKTVFELETLRKIGVTAGIISLVGILLIIAGQCFCIAVPKVARARIFIILSVLAMTTMAIALCVFLGIVYAQPEALIPDKPQAAAQPPMPEVPPIPDPAVPAADPPMPELPVIKTGPLWPGLTIPRYVKFFILATYLLGQIFFILFLKKVALFFHNRFLADSLGGYLTLLVLHTVLFALLPSAALIACFFWVIMLGVKFVLGFWMLMLLAAARKGIG